MRRSGLLAVQVRDRDPGARERLRRALQSPLADPDPRVDSSITFDGNGMTVQLQRPYHKGNTVDHYTPYPFNGRYDLRSREGN